MQTYSLDWNCVLALENSEPEGQAICELVAAHRDGKANVALLATSASENLRGERTFPESFTVFTQRVGRMGLSDLPVLNTPAVIGLAFIGRSYVVNEAQYRRMRNELWSLLFPNIPNDPPLIDDAQGGGRDVHSRNSARWRNAWCDVHSLITHIDHRRDVFVTANLTDFQRHSDSLARFGVRQIPTPSGASGMV